MTQSKLATSQFSFSLSTTPELFLGGMNPSQFVAGTTVWYPVTAQSYWIIGGNANVNGNAAVRGIGCIIDTGTSVIVVSSSHPTHTAIVTEEGVVRLLRTMQQLSGTQFQGPQSTAEDITPTGPSFT